MREKLEKLLARVLKPESHRGDRTILYYLHELEIYGYVFFAAHETKCGKSKRFMPADSGEFVEAGSSVFV